MAQVQVCVPDLGGIDEVEVIEIEVAVGDSLQAEDTLLVLESDKATMEVPVPNDGKVAEILVKVGDKVGSGSAVAMMEVAATDTPESEPETKVEPEIPSPSAAEKAPEQSAKSVSTGPVEVQVEVPDLGGIDQVEVIELCIKEGEALVAEESLLVLESDKATMEVPAVQSGKVLSYLVKVGDKVSQGDKVATMLVETEQGQAAPALPEQKDIPTSSVEPSAPVGKPETQITIEISTQGSVHAGPAVRKLAREMGVDLSKVSGSGPKKRIVKEDVQSFVKQSLKQGPTDSASVVGSSEDFSRYGHISEKPLSKIKQVTARNMVQSQRTIPQVTQFDEADITELEEYRKGQMQAQLPEGVRVSPLAFILKACTKALEKFPEFNASLGPNGDTLILKQYFNIGVAVDTPDGLLVPVIKGADSKGIVELAVASSELAKQARDKKLAMDAMSGGCFTISSLGGIGGTAFTPIVSAPQVAILGVSKAAFKPVWNGSSFEPRLMLPLSMSYDHRVIDGAQAAQFTRYLCQLLSDVRHLLL